MRTLGTVVVLTAAGVLMLAGSGGSWSQQINCSAGGCNSSPGQTNGSGRNGPSSQTQPQVSPSVSEPEGPLDTRLEQDQAKMRNMDRQKRLVDDTTRLVSLANELKASVDKSNKDTLSLDVIKKADEIEKLAHSVKEKMKGS